MTWLTAQSLTLVILGITTWIIPTSLQEEVAQDGELAPTIMIVLLVRNKAHVLRHTLALLEKQNYPKDRIALYVRSDHNEDESASILKEWLGRQSEYHSKNVVIDDTEGSQIRHYDQTEGPLQWSDSRFRHVMELKETALLEARKMWADFVWYLDADAFLVNPNTIKSMTDRSHFTIVGPMLTTVGLYSNFWAGMSDDYYYKRTDDYKPILDRKNKGCHQVPMVHSSVFVNLNKKESELLTFLPERVSGYDGPHDDIIVFALSADFNGVDMVVCNNDVYGYIMLPLDGQQSLQDDLASLSNLKIEMYAYGHRLPGGEDVVDRGHEATKLGFDNVYMINLERRSDRRSNMEAILKELNVDYEWVKAVDGKATLSDSYVRQNNIKMMEDFSEPYHGRPLKLGEIGCFLSHYNVWRDVLDKGFNEVIVFEDDIRFEPYFKHKLAAVKNELAAINLDWDLIFLGRKILHNVVEEWVENSTMLVHVNYTYWTLGYMLSRSGAQKLIDAKPLDKMVPVDEYLPIMYDQHPNTTWKGHYKTRNLKAFSVQPLLLYPTHYTGEEGYISDTEDSNVIAFESEREHDLRDEL